MCFIGGIGCAERADKACTLKRDPFSRSRQQMTKILPMSRNLQNILPHTEWIESQDNFEFATETFEQDFA